VPRWSSSWTPACRAWGAATMTTRSKLSDRRIYRQSIDGERVSIDLFSQRLQAAPDEPAGFTRRRGPDRETSKEQLSGQLRDQTGAGCPMTELQQVLSGQSGSGGSKSHRMSHGNPLTGRLVAGPDPPTDPGNRQTTVSMSARIVRPSRSFDAEASPPNLTDAMDV
jgi:hypothetical protein